jgi:hypothetical protein
MKINIDGVEYAPIKKIETDDQLLTALELRFDSDAGDNMTIRDYLRALITTLWREEEGFSGKRPFGNSGWSFDLFAPLIKAGFITGTLDDDGNVEDFDRREADQYVFKLIDVAFYGVATQ